MIFYEIILLSELSMSEIPSIYVCEKGLGSTRYSTVKYNLSNENLDKFK